MLFNVIADLGICKQVFLNGVSALNALLADGEPCAGLVDYLKLNAEVNDLADLGNTLAVHDVKLCLFERGSALVLYDLCARAVADHLSAHLECLDPAHVDTNGGVVFKRKTAGSGFRISVHNADLLTQLVYEYNGAAVFRDAACKTAHCLRHESCKGADNGVAHFAFKLDAGDKGCDRVNDNDVNRARAHEAFGYVERLLAGVRLRDEQTVDIDAQRTGVCRLERVLDVDVCRLAAGLLSRRDDVQRKRCFTRSLGSVYLDDPALGNAAYAESKVERERAC